MRSELNLLNLDEKDKTVKLVYLLQNELKDDPDRVKDTQALTLNKDETLFGLKGTHGLFASPEWWENIRKRKMPLKYVSGIIVRSYVAGQDYEPEDNEIDIKLDDGTVLEESIYVNDPSDARLFKIGHRVYFVCALDERKKQPAPDGGINYSDTVLEMAISLEPEV